MSNVPRRSLRTHHNYRPHAFHQRALSVRYGHNRNEQRTQSESTSRHMAERPATTESSLLLLSPDLNEMRVGNEVCARITLVNSGEHTQTESVERTAPNGQRTRVRGRQTTLNCITILYSTYSFNGARSSPPTHVMCQWRRTKKNVHRVRSASNQREPITRETTVNSLNTKILEGVRRQYEQSLKEQSTRAI